MYDLVSFVYRGKIRKKILQNLGKPHTPTELSLIIKTQRSTISRAIQMLVKKELVECITPSQKMGRYYRISKIGKEVLRQIQNE